MKEIVLASGSPRRAKILADLGFGFRVAKTDAEEVSIPHDPVRTVVDNALRKLLACRENARIIAADTIVWFDGKIYGKPSDLDEACLYLRELSGNTHVVFTGIAFRDEEGLVCTACARSDVTFRSLSDAEITDYVNMVRPLDRAGAYDIDESGDRIVASYSGSYENIMGLPVEPVKSWLKE